MRRVVYPGARDQRATKNGAQYPTGMAAANNRLVRRSVESDHIDQRLRLASVLVIVNAITRGSERGTASAD